MCRQLRNPLIALQYLQVGRGRSEEERGALRGERGVLGGGGGGGRGERGARRRRQGQCRDWDHKHVPTWKFPAGGGRRKVVVGEALGLARPAGQRKGGPQAGQETPPLPSGGPRRYRPSTNRSSWTSLGSPRRDSGWAVRNRSVNARPGMRGGEGAAYVLLGPQPARSERLACSTEPQGSGQSPRAKQIQKAKPAMPKWLLSATGRGQRHWLPCPTALPNPCPASVHQQ